MTHARTFRFGVQASTAGPDGDWAGLARKVEDLGFSSLFLPDHFGDQLAPVPAMMAAADATTDLRVGALVFDNDYKHPVVLAKEMATIDVLSGGRVEFGIGAGWMNTDYEQSGIPKDRDGVRIAKMVEALEIFKGLWGEGPFSFEGKHYTISGLDGLPKPVQKPHPPILIVVADRRCSPSRGSTRTSSASTRSSPRARSTRMPDAMRSRPESTRRCSG
jgi:probable F420-dependent oxidoreductase